MISLPYREFVNTHFKRGLDFPSSFVHAAIGLMGELLELHNANSREHLIEELGGTRFYWVQMGILLEEQGVSSPFSYPLQWEYLSLPSTIESLIDDANFLLDQAKKMWVYNKPPELGKLLVFHRKVGNLLDELSHLINISDHELEQGNMEKLKNSYPEGYTDQAAQVRKDKGGEE